MKAGIIKDLVDAIRDWVKGKLVDITALFPSQASSSNQLADKAFVNSSVQTATANFRGNWHNYTDVPDDASQYSVDYAGGRTPTVNDYISVEDASDYVTPGELFTVEVLSNGYYVQNALKVTFGSTITYVSWTNQEDYIDRDRTITCRIGGDGSVNIKSYQNKIIYNGTTYNTNTLIVIWNNIMNTAVGAVKELQKAGESGLYTGTWRFKYSGTWSVIGKQGWLPEYKINDAPLTAAQVAALNSGITAELVQVIAEIQANAGIPTLTIPDSTASQELAPNVLYIFSTRTSTLTLTLGTPIVGIANEYHFFIVCGSTAPTVNFPSGITWNGGSAPTISADKTYEVSILNNVAAYFEV